MIYNCTIILFIGRDGLYDKNLHLSLHTLSTASKRQNPLHQEFDLLSLFLSHNEQLGAIVSTPEPQGTSAAIIHNKV